MLAGCFGQLAGVVGLAVYLALGITENQGIVRHQTVISSMLVLLFWDQDLKNSLVHKNCIY